MVTVLVGACTTLVHICAFLGVLKQCNQLLLDRHFLFLFFFCRTLQFLLAYEIFRSHDIVLRLLLLLWRRCSLLDMLSQLIWPVYLDAEEDWSTGLRLEYSALKRCDVQDGKISSRIIDKWDVDTRRQVLIDFCNIPYQLQAFFLS